jgi:hypothetical protein
MSRGTPEYEPEGKLVQAFACAESIFKTLKRELETPGGKYSPGEVRQPVFMYL